MHKKKLVEVNEKLVNELVALESLKNSPHVIKCEEFIKTDNNYWLVTEFCNGGCLEELISKNPNGLNTSVMRTLMRKILDGFSELIENDLL